MRLKRRFDNWVFSGDFFEYTPAKARQKINEISVIRGPSRYQGLGYSGTLISFTIRFYLKNDFINFSKHLDKIYQFTDELGVTYEGLFVKDPEVKKIGEFGMYEVKLSMNSMQNPGEGI